MITNRNSLLLPARGGAYTAVPYPPAGAFWGNDASLKYDQETLSVFLEHRSALVDYATPILGCRSQAEDVVQEAYLRVCSVHQPSGNEPSILHPVAYLFRTVRNLALNSIRRQNAEKTVAIGGDVMDSMVSSAPSPEHQALYRDELETIARALDDLPDRTRRAFELHRLGGYTFHQVAETLGISVGLAHKLVRDALTHCADRLDDHD